MQMYCIVTCNKTWMTAGTVWPLRSPSKRHIDINLHLYKFINYVNQHLYIFINYVNQHLCKFYKEHDQAWSSKTRIDESRTEKNKSSKKITPPWCKDSTLSQKYVINNKYKNIYIDCYIFQWKCQMIRKTLFCSDNKYVCYWWNIKWKIQFDVYVKCMVRHK